MKKYSKKTIKREFSLDILRGIVIFLMLWAHTVSFISFSGLDYSKKSFLNASRDFGDTVCFSTFLLISGASLAYVIMQKRNKKLPQSSTQLKRILKLLVGYYLIALLASLKTIDSFRDLIEILFFIKVPGYTEFLIPFIFFGIIAIYQKKCLVKILVSKHKNLIIFLLSVLIYSLGFIIFDIEDLNYPWLNWKALLGGTPGLIRFPILEYTPLFLIGLLVGSILYKGRKHDLGFLKEKNFYILFSLALAILIQSRWNIETSKFPFNESYGRWPPTISFLARGLIFSLTLLILIKIAIWKNYFKKIRFGLTFFGRQSFDIFIAHIAILLIYNHILDKRTESLTLLLIAYFILIISSLYLAQFIKFSFDKLLIDKKE